MNLFIFYMINPLHILNKEIEKPIDNIQFMK